MLLNCKQCYKKCYSIAFALECLSTVPNDFHDNDNDSNVGINESIFFSLVCQNANECPKMLLNVD